MHLVTISRIHRKGHSFLSSLMPECDFCVEFKTKFEENMVLLSMNRESPTVYTWGWFRLQ